MTNTKDILLTEKGRLDKQIANNIDLSRSRIQQLIKDGKIRLEGNVITDKSRIVSSNTTIEIDRNSLNERTELQPKKGPLTVLYEDETILALYKPSGLLVHPTSNEPLDTLANRILFHYPDQANVGPTERAGLVHRLDRGTSGVILVGRTEEAYENLKNQFRRRSVKKTYQALVKGRVEDESILVDVPVGRHPGNPTLRHATPEGKEATTKIKTIATNQQISALKCFPKTGRTHQIRVHCEYLGHQILGDKKYGNNSKERLMLHAETIEFRHPKTDDFLSISADTPPEVNQLWTSLSSQ
jgi:23S rRNA pseudouridine1911/1915/1917 synthase